MDLYIHKYLYYRLILYILIYLFILILGFVCISTFVIVFFRYILISLFILIRGLRISISIEDLCISTFINRVSMHVSAFVCIHTFIYSFIIFLKRHVAKHINNGFNRHAILCDSNSLSTSLGMLLRYSS